MASEQPKKVTGGAFGRYMAEHRAALLKEFAGKPATESIKIGSQRFKEISATDKAKYEKQYDEAKQKYSKDMAAFLAAGGQPKAKKQKREKKEMKVTDPNKPKKPAGGGYGCYLAKHRQSMVKECAGKPITAVSKLAGERWKALSAEEKKPFESEYATKKAAYEKAMKSYAPPAGAADGSEDDNEEEEEAQQTSAKAKVAKKANKESAKEPKKKMSKTETPKKRKTEAKPAPKKRARTVASEPVGVELSDAVIKKAQGLGMEPALRNLAKRDGISVSGPKLLAVLEANGGLVNKAKAALLGA